jgi:ribosomal protein L12E/L44/L45/RPP1/RPP2
MAKNGWTKEYVETSAKALGWTVPPENFVVIKPKRERPKKMEARPLPPLPVEEDAEDAIKSTLADLGVLTRAHVSPSKVPDHDEELDEEPLADDIKPIESPAEAPAPAAPAAPAEAAAPEAAEEEHEAPAEEHEDHARGRKGRDYTKLTAADVPALNPSTLRTACTQNGIDIEGKKPAALRVELINKLA